MKFHDIKALPQHLKDVKVNEPKFAHYNKTVYKVSNDNKKLTRLNGSYQTVEFFDNKELYFKFINGKIALAFHEQEELEFVYVNQDDRPKEKPMT